MEKYESEQKSYPGNLDAILFSENFKNKVLDNEEELNSLTNPENYDYIHKLEEDLNDALNFGEFPQDHCTVIGKAYKGDDYVIFSDTSDIGSEPNNIMIGALRNLDFQGVAIDKEPGDVKYSTFLVFKDSNPNKTIATDIDFTAESYYFKYEDVISASTIEYVNSELLVASMKAHAYRSHEIVENIHVMNNMDQHDLLRKLASEASYDIMAMIGDEEVSVDTDIFYEINYSKKGRPFVSKTTNRDKKSCLRSLPTGIVQGCAFVETILDDIIREPQLGELYEQEPCLVLVDENFAPMYLVPISKINDIAVI